MNIRQLSQEEQRLIRDRGLKSVAEVLREYRKVNPVEVQKTLEESIR